MVPPVIMGYKFFNFRIVIAIVRHHSPLPGPSQTAAPASIRIEWESARNGNQATGLDA